MNLLHYRTCTWTVHCSSSPASLWALCSDDSLVISDVFADRARDEKSSETQHLLLWLRDSAGYRLTNHSAARGCLRISRNESSRTSLQQTSWRSSHTHTHTWPASLIQMLTDTDAREHTHTHTQTRMASLIQILTHTSNLIYWGMGGERDERDETFRPKNKVTVSSLWR